MLLFSYGGDNIFGWERNSFLRLFASLKDTLEATVEITYHDRDLIEI
jgi:hypothetical protein